MNQMKTDHTFVPDALGRMQHRCQRDPTTLLWKEATCPWKPWGTFHHSHPWITRAAPNTNLAPKQWHGLLGHSPYGCAFQLGRGLKRLNLWIKRRKQVVCFGERCSTIASKPQMVLSLWKAMLEDGAGPNERAQQAQPFSPHRPACNSKPWTPR